MFPEPQFLSNAGIKSAVFPQRKRELFASSELFFYGHDKSLLISKAHISLARVLLLVQPCFRFLFCYFYIFISHCKLEGNGGDAAERRLLTGGLITQLSLFPA